MTYGGFKDLNRRTAADKVLRDEAFNIAENPKCDGYKPGLGSVIYKCFDKRSSGGGAMLTSKSAIKIENIYNKELAEELQKPVIRKFNKRKVRSPFIDSIFGGRGRSSRYAIDK